LLVVSSATETENAVEAFKTLWTMTSRAPRMHAMSNLVLSTSIGELPLEEVQLAIGDREWSILHTGALIGAQAEVDFLRGENQAKRPYGIALWPSALALAHDLASRDVRGKRILELGAGTGLPGIVAASLGAHVVQTDRQKVVLHVCKMNGERNRIDPAHLEQHLADWTT